MRMTRAFGLIAVAALATAGTLTPVGAATPVTKCTGPPTADNAGSVAFVPGLNGFASKQKTTFKIRLTGCAPTKPTGGVGTIKSTFTTALAQTCAFYTAPHTFNTTATITWKNVTTSTLKVRFALTGSTRLVNVTGSVTAGTLSGHTFTGQYHYKPVPAHNNTTIVDSCANKVAPGQPGRLSIGSLALTRTKPFIVT